MVKNLSANWRRAAGAPALALVALGALAVWPLLRVGYPVIGDGLIHFYRLVEFEHLLEQGVWFPRWATDLGYGYGYPLFNYYPPLTYYLGALFGGLRFSNTNSLLGVYVAAWLLAMSGAYWLARERGGQTAGLLAAAAYGLAPYLYFDALARAALPEVLGLGLLPWVLWACYRLTVQPSRGRLMLAALLLAALALTHLLTVIFAIPLIALFWLMALFSQTSTSLKNRYHLAIALLLGLGLAAYFFLPAVLETRLVQIGQLTQPADLDFHNNFLAVGDLLALPRPFDARLVFRAVPPSLSLAALALAMFGLARRAWLARRGQHGLEAWDIGLWVGLIGLCLFTLQLSQLAWEHLPGASLIQFPWRLVGPASLLLALLVARAVESNNGKAGEGRALDPGQGSEHGPVSDRPLRVIAGPRFGRWAQMAGPALALAGLFFFSLTWTFYTGPPAPATAGVRDLAGYERDSGQLGTTSTGEFLPASVARLPDSHSLDLAYALHSVIDRLGALPAGASVVSQTATVTSAGAMVTASAPAQLTFEIFDFAGWRATVDGQPAPIIPSQPNGFITVAMPAGQHTVAVAFGPTPLRTVATAISFMAAGLLAIIASGRVRIGAEDLTPRPPSPKGKGVPLKHDAPMVMASAFTVTVGFGLVAVGLLAVRLVAIDGHDTVFARSQFDGEQVAGAGQTFDINFDDQLVLIGLDLPSRTMAADAALPLTLYWRAQNVPRADDATTVQVLDDAGNVWGQADSQNPGGLPTSRWTTEQYARDVHALRLRPGTPPGQYHLVAGVYQTGGAALSVLDVNRTPQGVTQTLGTLMVSRATRPPATIGAARPANVALGRLTYLGGSLSTNSPQAGDDLTVELFWRAEGATRPDLTMHLALAGAGGAAGGPVIAAWDLPPARSDYPTSDWSQGEIVRSVARLRVPATAPAGVASLQLSLAGAPGLPVATQIAALNLRVPARSYSAPPMTHVLNVSVGLPVRLLGYDLDASGVTLYWQAAASMDTSYSVFVHALDTAGTIVSQVDAPPLNGSRPTTGWLPGEVLTDRYNLSFSGATALEVGLYDPVTRQRLGTVNIPLR